MGKLFWRRLTLAAAISAITFSQQLMAQGGPGYAPQVRTVDGWEVVQLSGVCEIRRPLGGPAATSIEIAKARGGLYTVLLQPYVWSHQPANNARFMLRVFVGRHGPFNIPATSFNETSGHTGFVFQGDDTLMDALIREPILSVIPASGESMTSMMQVPLTHGAVAALNACADAAAGARPPAR